MNYFKKVVIELNKNSSKISNPDKSSIKKRIISVFFILEPDTTVGISSRINKYQWLSEEYNLILLTNQANFLKKKIPLANIIKIPYIRIPILSIYIFWLICGIRLLFFKYDLLYLGYPEAPISYFNYKKPFLCLIYQSHEITWSNSKFKRKSIWNLLPRITHKIYSFLVIRGVKNSDYSVVVSRQLIEYFNKNGVDKKKMEFLPYGVNLELFSPKKQINQDINNIIPNNKFVMIYAGSINEKRGLDFLINGTKEITKILEDVLLVIIGVDNNYMEIINKKIKDKNLENYVIIMKHINHDLIPDYLQRSNVCLSFLEINETYSISPPQKIFEYFAMGKPVVANRIPTHNDYIKDGVNGFIINFNELEFRDAILKLYRDKKLYLQMSNNAKVTAKNYNVEINNKKLGKIMERLIYLNKNNFL
jgi:glycosyltransferase involved in cell wall biosynthesis